MTATNPCKVSNQKLKGLLFNHHARIIFIVNPDNFIKGLKMKNFFAIVAILAFAVIPYALAYIFKW